ncbi:hypothetical protein S101446_03399 (plasmid) [Komagataeibacter europaeus]|nr:hypothetical protein S101446_03399 [Komagataeibacter europaeus]
MHTHAVEDGHEGIGCLPGQVTETAGIRQNTGSALKRRTTLYDFAFGFHEADDMPDIDIFRGPGQADAAIPAPGSHQDTMMAQVIDDLHEMVVGDVVPFGDVPDRHAIQTLMAGQIDQQAKSVIGT